MKERQMVNTFNSVTWVITVNRWAITELLANIRKVILFKTCNIDSAVEAKDIIAPGAVHFVAPVDSLDWRPASGTLFHIFLVFQADCFFAGILMRWITALHA